MLCWVLGLLVLPMVSSLAPGVSAGEGVVAFGLGGCGSGVGGGAGVGVAISGVGVGVVGCWVLLGVGARHSSLRAWWVYPCVLAVFLAALQLPWRGLLGSCSLGFRVLCAFVVRAVLALWCVVCVCGARVGGACGGMCCVRAWACVRCVGGAFGCLSSPFWAWFGGSVWVRGLCVVAPLPPRLWGPGVFPLAGVGW